MSDEDDKVGDASGEYIAVDESEERGVQAKDETPLELGVVNTFLGAIRLRNMQKAHRAFGDLIAERTRIRNLTADENRSLLEEERTIRLLEDAETVHKADKEARDAELSRARAHRKKAEHDEGMADLFHEAEDKHVRAQHTEIMKGRGDVDESSLSVEAQELKDNIKSNIKGELDKARLAREVAEEIICESKDLSPEDIEFVREQAKKYERANK